MDSFSKILLEISVPTHNLNIRSIQDILLKAKENYKCNNHNKAFWIQVAKILWSHLHSGLKNLDDQLLCATCLFTVLTFIEDIGPYMVDLLTIIDEEIIKKTENKLDTKTFQVVSMMYGMFQSSYLTQKTSVDIPKILPVVKSALDLLVLMGYEYSKYTFLVFKTIKLSKKVCGTYLQQHIFNKENIIRLFNLVNHNWENPITGLRELNRNIFQTLLSVVDEPMYKELICQIDGFYWNKAKYLMLSEVIGHNNGDIIFQVYHSKWVDGLIKSLYKPGLVSAGADMYYALLKKINTDDIWCKLFLNNIITMFNDTNNKAIENFINYWCVTTMKKFPTITDIFINEFKGENDSEQKLYSNLCIMKQANKLGIIDKNWSTTADYKETENIVLHGIKNCNNYIRILAFDIVCISQGKTMPTSMEYELILTFLANNVNSDCTVLRLSMLSSFNYFLIRLHSSFLNNVGKNSDHSDIDNLLDFCKKLQDFVRKSLSLNGNYQRKITSVKLCESIIGCLSEVPKKKKGQARTVNLTLIQFLKDKGCWTLSDDNFVMKLISLLKDPADDIRESVIKLLLNHFSLKLRKTLLNYLIDDGLKCMKSKFFYEISCGQSIFKLIANLLIRQKHLDARFTCVEDIFLYGYKELTSEYRLNTDIVKSIESGRQLHSFMSILLVVLEVCHLNLYKLDISSVMAAFLDTLEGISNQFHWEQHGLTSSDFSKMSDMVHNIIVNSGHNPCDEGDQTKISGLQQIVLNSLWLNVKGSCDLASVLIRYNLNNAVMAEKCLTIITHVLETSRHKGAIEAAGVSLARAIQCLSTLPEENEASKVPHRLLKCKLQDLISETFMMSSITRRGAGLSIMVHRIVSSDMKAGKPLFHYFMNTILEACNNIDCIEIKRKNEVNDENQIDLPKAIYIHFMTRIVTDSTLATDLMYYSAQLAELAFGNLTSPQWQIRNAALQLYGALIPRLIGQKKALGNDEVISTVGYDELRTHSPKLWIYITEQLSKARVLDQIQHNSNLLPILNMLSSCAKRYNFELDTSEETQDDGLLNCFLRLLGSPIYTVRRLTAKCIFNIYDLDSIYSALIHEEYMLENFIHGSLILLHLIHKFYSLEERHEEKFNGLKKKFENELKSNQHSYICKQPFEDLYINELSIGDMRETFVELNKNIHMAGVCIWAETRLIKYLNSCLWHDTPTILKLILQQSDYEKYCQHILLKLEAHSNESKESYMEILNILNKFEHKYCSSIIWKIIYEISKKIDINGQIDFFIPLKKLNEEKTRYKYRYMIPLIARNILNVPDDTQVSVVNLISELSNFDNSDVDIRYIATLANNELAYQFDHLPDVVKVTSIKCAVILLQDEDDDVRNLSVNFYKILSKGNTDLQAYICLNNVLSVAFLNKLFNDPKTSISELCTELSNILLCNQVLDEYNPFANDSKNIYLEPEVLKILIKEIKC